MRQAERALAIQAQRAYQRTIADWQANKVGAGATPGRASQKPSSGKAARQTSKPQRSALELRQSPAPQPHSPTAARPDPHHLTFIRRPTRAPARSRPRAPQAGERRTPPGFAASRQRDRLDRIESTLAREAPRPACAQVGGAGRGGRAVFVALCCADRANVGSRPSDHAEDY
jgi:hypothetical protein